MPPDLYFTCSLQRVRGVPWHHGITYRLVRMNSLGTLHDPHVFGQYLLMILPMLFVGKLRHRVDAARAARPHLDRVVEIKILRA